MTLGDRTLGMIEMVIDIWIYIIQRHVIVKHDCNIHLCDDLIITNICIFIFEHYMFICIDSPEDPETRKKSLPQPLDVQICSKALKLSILDHFSASNNAMAKLWLSRQASESYGRSKNGQM